MPAVPVKQNGTRSTLFIIRPTSGNSLRIYPRAPRADLADLHSDRFVAGLVAEARRLASPTPTDAFEPRRRWVAELTARIGKLADFSAQVETPRPFLEKIQEAEVERKARSLSADRGSKFSRKATSGT